jgi:uncharacterized membrane protein
MSTAGIIVLICALLITGIVFYKTIITREWRNKAPQEAESWYGGIFYYNKKDSRLFLPKRTGLGWTINFAHPLGIVLMILIIVLTITLILI